MAQATFSIRMDEQLKKQFDELCSDFGMSASTAMTVFAKTVVRERRIPFEISSPLGNTAQQKGLRAFFALREEARKNGLQGMPLEEIDAEIAAVRSNRSGSEA